MPHILAGGGSFSHPVLGIDMGWRHVPGLICILSCHAEAGRELSGGRMVSA